MKRLHILCAVYGICSVGMLDAGTYFRESGNTFITAGVTFARTASFWSTSGDKESWNNKYDKDIYNLYVEHDVTDRDTLVGQVVVTDVQDTLSGAAACLDEVEIGWQRALYRTAESGHEVAVRLLSVIPGGGLDHPHSRLGRWGGELGIAYSSAYSCKSFPLATTALVAYRWYADYPADQLRCTWRQGIELLEWLQVQSLVDFQYGLANGSKATARGRPVLGQWRFARIWGLARIRLNHHLSLVSGYFNNVWAENYYGGGGWTATLWSEF